MSSECGDVFLTYVGPSVVSEALVLRARAYGESDKIVTLLTRDAGKLTGIAKGAKNSKRRFINCLDPFTRVRLHYKARPGASLIFMQSCDLLQAAGVLVDPIKFAYGSYLLELVDLLTEEAHPIEGMFELLVDALDVLRLGPATAAFLRAFELRLLCDAGYEPRLLHCGRCHRSLSTGDPVALDTDYHAVVCSDCARAGVVPTAGVSLEDLQVLDTFKRLPLAEIRQLRMNPGRTAAVAQLMSLFLAPHLRRPLKSLKLIAALSA